MKDYAIDIVTKVDNLFKGEEGIEHTYTEVLEKKIEALYKAYNRSMHVVSILISEKEI